MGIDDCSTPQEEQSSEKEEEHQCPREQRPQQQGAHGEKVKVAEVLV